MKNLMKFLGIIALVAIVGFSVLSCGEASEIPGTPTIPKGAPADIYDLPAVTDAKIPAGYTAVNAVELDAIINDEVKLQEIFDSITNINIPLEFSIRSLITPRVARAARAVNSGFVVFSDTDLDGDGEEYFLNQLSDYTFLNGYASYTYNDMDDENFAVSGIAQFRLDLDNGIKATTPNKVQEQEPLLSDGEPVYDKDGKPVMVGKVDTDGNPVMIDELDKDGKPVYKKTDGNVNGVATLTGKAEMSLIGEVLTIKALNIDTGAIVAVMDSETKKALKIGLTVSSNVNNKTYTYSDFFPEYKEDMTDKEKEAYDKAMAKGEADLIDEIMSKITLYLTFYGSGNTKVTYDLEGLLTKFSYLLEGSEDDPEVDTAI